MSIFYWYGCDTKLKKWMNSIAILFICIAVVLSSMFIWKAVEFIMDVQDLLDWMASVEVR